MHSYGPYRSAFEAANALLAAFDELLETTPRGRSLVEGTKARVVFLGHLQTLVETASLLPHETGCELSREVLDGAIRTLPDWLLFPTQEN